MLGLNLNHVSEGATDLRFHQIKPSLEESR